MFHDENGNFLENNEERMIFYCKGVIETVKKKLGLTLNLFIVKDGFLL